MTREADPEGRRYERLDFRRQVEANIAALPQLEPWRAQLATQPVPRTVSMHLRRLLAAAATAGPPVV